VKLWLAEKPDAGRKIAAALGGGRPGDGHVTLKNGDVVTWAIGHLLGPKVPGWFKFDDLPYLPDTLDIVPPTGPNDAYRRKQLGVVRGLLKRADEVVLAGDMGREGELIGREILDHAGFRGKVWRAAITSLEPSDLRKAVNDLADAEKTRPFAIEAEARQYEDHLLGLNGTMAATAKLKPPALGKRAISIGPVQTPTLALIVERDLAIENFKPRDYYVVRAETKTESGARLVLFHPSPYASENNRIWDAKEAADTAHEARGAKGPLKVETKEEKAGPPFLFDLANLQRATGMDPSETLKAAQKLYDDGILTYPRSDNQFLPYSQIEKAPRILEMASRMGGLLGDAARTALKDDKLTIRKGKRYNTDKVGEHHAIVPTGKAPDLNALPPAQRHVFLTVLTNFVQNHLPDAIDLTTRVSMEVNAGGKQRPFEATGTIEKSPGWRIVKGAREEAAAPEANGPEAKKAGSKSSPDAKSATGAAGAQRLLPPLKDGETARIEATAVDKKTTEPPKRIKIADIPHLMGKLIEYVPDNLKAALANPADPDKPKGLGTPATRSNIVDILFDRLYVARRGKTEVQSTDLGRALITRMKSIAPDFSDPVSRAVTEGGLAAIGLARSTDHARRQAETYVTAARRKTMDLIRSFGSAERLAVDGGSIDTGPPTPKMKLAVKSFAKRFNVRVPKGAMSSGVIAKQFLQELKEKYGEAAMNAASAAQMDMLKKLGERTGKPVDPETMSGITSKAASLLIDQMIKDSDGGTPRQASENSISFAQVIAQRNGIELPRDKEGKPLTDQRSISEFINKHKAPLNAAGPSSASGWRPAAKKPFGPKAAAQTSSSKPSSPSRTSRGRADAGR
jgi:DNA topoisomerase-3